MRILVGDALAMLSTLETESVDCIVTSPPYWGLRDYGVDGQIGLEPTLEEFLDRLESVFSECRRVLKKSGTLWINIGDSYSGNGGQFGSDKSTLQGTKQDQSQVGSAARFVKSGPPNKSMIGVPWRLALRLLDNQKWCLRNELIWEKTNGMPESAEDRCTRNHEQLFFFVKSRFYWSDFDALRTESKRPESVTAPHSWASSEKYHEANPAYAARKKHENPREVSGSAAGIDDRKEGYSTAMPRSVWKMAIASFKGAHFATFPEELPRRCILAGCPPGGIVLDPFAGSGTVLEVALSLGRDAIGIELNPKYAELIRQRLGLYAPELEVAS